jgi:hypothetical protein
MPGCVGVLLVYERPDFLPAILLGTAFILQNTAFSGWAMLGSNQRPLPCEVKALLLPLFVVVQKYLQNGVFYLRVFRVCSPLFVWVGVLLV